ncbi:hypothetical protein GSI_15317 [Ganoderma sinense ZZ0214-1]|uniref:GST N-terminal domain-containing protein n=1 Tax=Ganoderma sinense ZZ0214-1 TaxID=1077348 RepID=A0A2G8RM86_9APHY|nr:hypothetical protein GSI_15317 [Ganoderma sinense ZZ0214-1]
MEPILFYDIPSHVRGCVWSPNTWKTRYSLNYKGLPYTTVWVEYPDIAPLSKKIGAAPTDKAPDGTPQYTLPAIYDPNTKTTVSDSAVIARYLDKTYPDKPTLIPPEADALHAAFNEAFRAALMPDLLQIMLPATHAQLRAKSDKYFRATRETRFGAKLEEFAPVGSEKRERHWKGIEQALDTFAQWLSAGGQEKLFFLGDRISYADMTVAGFLVWIKIVLGEDSKEWQDVLKWNDGRWARFMDAFTKYSAVDVGTDVEL